MNGRGAKEFYGFIRMAHRHPDFRSAQDDGFGSLFRQVISAATDALQKKYSLPLTYSDVPPDLTTITENSSALSVTRIHFFIHDTKPELNQI